MQSQWVAVEQHETQIFLTRGFDDCVLCVKSVGAKPVQKLRKHSKLVQAGGGVHCILGVCVLIVGNPYLCVILNPIRISQGEDKVGELVPLEFGDEPLVLLVGELACVVFKDGLSSFITGCVKEHDRCYIVPVWLGDAGYLLGQDPHGDAVMPGTKPEIDQLPRATLDIFRRGAIVQYEQGVGPREEVAGQSQPGLDLMLQARDYKDVRIAGHEALVCLVLDKCGAEEHDVVKLTSEGAPQLV